MHLKLSAPQAKTKNDINFVASVLAILRFFRQHNEHRSRNYVQDSIQLSSNLPFIMVDSNSPTVQTAILNKLVNIDNADLNNFNTAKIKKQQHQQRHHHQQQ